MFEKKDLKLIRKNLYHHVDVLSNQIGERTIANEGSLQKTVDYIWEQMQRSSLELERVNFSFEGHTFTNIVAEKKGSSADDQIILIGAHYDTVEDSPGADDNATGIAALLEMVRLFDEFDNRRTYRFVAFALEEPPYHGTPQMGSHMYAELCQQRCDNVLFMTSLEMLGYFLNKENSQRYPQPQLALKHPSRGNFISVVGDEESKPLVKTVSKTIANFTRIPIEIFITHRATPGANLSDHASFWKFGFRAIMITDTAFYRNPHYHKPDDTIDTINFKKFANLLNGIAAAYKEFDETEFKF
ncbi:M28 family peptidase [candidate division KSB1 bacterium]|nr:M28 family peptidase [candidate division KSB1 bacterium]